MYMNVYLCVAVYICVWMYNMCMYVWVCVCVYICMYVYMLVPSISDTPAHTLWETRYILIHSVSLIRSSTEAPLVCYIEGKRKKAPRVARST